MRQKIDKRAPRYGDLIAPTFTALKKLGGSGNNDEILAQLIELLSLPDEVVDISHKGHESMTELAYQAAWAHTYLRSYSVIENASRSVWAITSKYAKADTVDGKEIVAEVVKLNAAKRNGSSPDTSASNPVKGNDTPEDDGVEAPDEVKEWRVRLTDILQNMNSYGFERLT